MLNSVTKLCSLLNTLAKLQPQSRLLLPRSPFSSSSSSRRSNFHNYYLRKRRKCPLSPYKSKWHETFSQQQALETLKQSAKSSTHLLSSLTDAFEIYECDPTPSAYRFVIKILSNTSDWGQLSQVLDHLENVDKIETPEYIFVDLFRVYGGADMFEEAIQLFYRISNFRCTPSAYCLNGLLSVLCKKKEGLLFVPQIILKSQAMNIRFEELSYSLLIKALCRVKKVDYALKLLNHMVDDGFDLDGKACSLILSTMCGQRDLSSDEFIGFLEEMRKLGFCPRKTDWCNVIRFLVKKEKGIHALSVLNQMRMDGLLPNIICYTMVLDGLILENEFVKADEVFDEMLIRGLVPDIYTYNVYIKGLCKQKKVEEALQMIPCMEQLGWKPDLITYNTVLRDLCENGKLDRAKEVLREMGSKGVEANSKTYNLMIDGLVRKGEKD